MDFRPDVIHGRDCLETIAVVPADRLTADGAGMTKRKAHHRGIRSTTKYTMALIA